MRHPSKYICQVQLKMLFVCFSKILRFLWLGRLKTFTEASLSLASLRVRVEADPQLDRRQHHHHHQKKKKKKLADVILWVGELHCFMDRKGCSMLMCCHCSLLALADSHSVVPVIILAIIIIFRGSSNH